MKKLFLIILFFTLIFTSGCYNYKELNDLAIISAIGVEKVKDDYLVTAQIVNIKKTGSEAGNEGISKVVTYKGKGKNIDTALRNISNEASKDIFLSHLKMLIIDADVIKNNLTEVTDFFSRNTDSNLTFYVATSTTDKPSEILKTLTPLDSLPSQDIYNLIEKSEEKIGNANVMTFEELIDILLKKGKNPVYTNLKISGKENSNENTDSLKEAEPSSLVEINNLVTFDNTGNMLVLNKDESIGYSFINNKIKQTLLTAKCKDNNNYFSVEITGSKSKLKMKNKNLNIDLKLTGTIGDITCNKDISDIKTRTDINKIITKKIEKMVKNSADLTKENNNDFIGFGNYIYKSKKNYFDFKKDDWDKEGIKNLNILVNVNLEIVKEGNLDKNINGREINEK